MSTLQTSPPAAAATVAGAEPPPRRRRHLLLPYGLLAPAAAVLALVLGYPLVRLVLISLQDYGLRSLFTGAVGWAGLANYLTVLQSPDLGPVLVRSIGFCAALVIGTLVIGLGVALLMGGLGRRMRVAVMFALIAAWAIPNVASTLVWQWLFQPVYGVVNWLLTRVGVFGDLTQRDWTTSAFSAFALVWLLVVWQSVPFVALTLHAGLTQIPRSYYEAAAIDGAGPVRAFTTITLPFLRPILGLVTILSVIWDFTVFNQIWILTQGGPGGQTTTLGIWTFTTAFSKNSFGQGGAIAVVSVVLLVAMTAVYVRRLVRSGEAL
ncbi:carbohydrate ABC transporter permease [Kutzneria sp. 744]|uniref:carbohydrate ABC transporter permease n=1 Tax=Kutzneria sp. (strain 744) TaxID=345341 RepID=UPI0003EED269|nr:sugar ABC transporter permease [Kutzneria sp. 744]EWM10775.1 ABC sugar transporter permease component [Kutzneria sp. 744]